MKKFFKWINLIVVIIIICFIAFILLKIDLNTAEGLKELIIGLATFLLALVPISYYLISISKIEYRTFTECNRRFDKINECLSEIEIYCENEKEGFEYGRTVTGCKDKKSAKQHILDYLDLCAEEYYLYKYSGIVPRIVWEHWLRGMESYFKKDNIFQKVLKDEINKYRNNKDEIKDSYYGFLDFLRKKLELKDK